MQSVADAKTAEQLFEENQKFALWMANKYRNFENIEDLVQQAYIGLFQAAQTFDTTHGTKFTTYAYPIVWRKIFRFIEKSNPVHIPRQVIEHSRLIKRIEFETLSVMEIAEQTGLSESRVKQALQYMALRITSTDETVYTDDPLTVGETIASNEENWDELILIKDFMTTLDEREKTILNMRIDGYFQQEIGEALGMSQVHASRLLRKIKAKFQNYIA